MKLGTKVASIGISFREIFQKKNEWGSPLRMKSVGKCHNLSFHFVGAKNMDNIKQKISSYEKVLLTDE